MARSIARPTAGGKGTRTQNLISGNPHKGRDLAEREHWAQTAGSSRTALDGS
jgi:hypothetical protein